MMTRSLTSKLVSIACLAGAYLFVACDGGPSSEGSGTAACEGECDATNAPGDGREAAPAAPADGGNADEGADPQRSANPSTCFVPEGAACVFDELGTGECKSESDCAWRCRGLPQLCGNEPVVLDPYGNVITGDLNCVIRALRDGTEGELRWKFSNGIFLQSRTITILPGRRALRAAINIADHYVEGGLDGPAPLSDSSYFETCFGLTDVYEIHACLKEGLEGCSITS